MMLETWFFFLWDRKICNWILSDKRVHRVVLQNECRRVCVCVYLCFFSQFALHCRARIRTHKIANDFLILNRCRRELIFSFCARAHKHDHFDRSPSKMNQKPTNYRWLRVCLKINTWPIASFFVFRCFPYSLTHLHFMCICHRRRRRRRRRRYSRIEFLFAERILFYNGLLFFFSDFDCLFFFLLVVFVRMYCTTIAANACFSWKTEYARMESVTW